jgi:hypothetical protein
MKIHTFNRKRDRAAILIVVVGVLAILSLLAATFGMVMSTERAATRNQTEYELAGQAAKAGYEYLLQTLRNTGVAALQASGAPLIDADPDSPFGSMLLGYRNGKKIYAITAERDTNTYPELTGLPHVTGVGAINSGVFSLNGGGRLGDLGGIPDRGTRTDSYQTSLARLLEAGFDTITDTAIDGYISNFTTTSATQLRIAQLVASAIITHRYGSDGLPGQYAFDDHHMGHLLPHVSWPDLALQATNDIGVATQGDFWGLASSTPALTALYQDYSVSGTATAVTATTLTDSTATWTVNDKKNLVVYIWSGTAAGNWRTIRANTATQLSVFPDWTAIPDATSKYVIINFENVWDADGWVDSTVAMSPAEYMPAFDDGTTNKNLSRTLPAVGANTPWDLTFGTAWSQLAATGDAFAIDGSLIGATDDSPTAVIWPNGIVNCERFVFPRVLHKSTIVSATTNSITVSDNWEQSALGAAGILPDTKLIAIVITSGDGRGQLRQINSNSNWTLTSVTYDLFDNWTTDPQAGDTYEIIYDAFDAGTVTSRTSDTLSDSSKAWEVNCFRGCAVNITADGSTPDAQGQTRLILSNTATTLTLARLWQDMPSTDTSATYRIELPQDYKYRPDSLLGDDRIYRSVAEILPVMVKALELDGLNTTDAGVVAGILYNSVKDYLTVGTESIEKRSEYASVNDPTTDGIDNDADGIVDNESYTTAEYALYFYNQSGLAEWANSPTSSSTRNTRIQQAAQLIANIIDFRDADHVPTELTATDIGEDEKTTWIPAVRGYEGVHITEVMGTPTIIDLASGMLYAGNNVGKELNHDGNNPTTTVDVGAPTPPFFLELKDASTAIPNPNPGWDYDGVTKHCWVLQEAAIVTGQWSYNKANVGTSYTFEQGWYAIRIKASASTEFIFTASDGRTGKFLTDADGWGYVRAATNWPNSKLLAVEVDAAETLTFKLAPTAAPANPGEVLYYGFQLLPQYFELTNCAATDAILTEITWKSVNPTDPSATIDRTLTLPANTRIRGAAANGTYPISYGRLIIAMSEDAYERTFGDASGVWGDTDTERTPVLFLGDIPGATAATWDDNADKLLLTRDDQTITVETANGIIAETGDSEVDGQIGKGSDSIDEYFAKEKDLAAGWPFGPDWANVGTSPAAPSGDQAWPLILNRSYPTAGWLGLVPTGSAPWRTIDRNPDIVSPDYESTPDAPEKLLGTLLEHTTSGGAHSRINLNFGDSAKLEAALKSIFNDTTADEIANNIGPWKNWDHLLSQSYMQDLFHGNGLNDSGAGLFADDAADDADEQEEWARRYANVVDLQSSTFKYVIAGLVYKDSAQSGEAPLAEVRIEVEIDVSGTDVQVLNFRYITD